MARKTNLLKPSDVDAALLGTPRLYPDGGGLYLSTKNDQPYWLLRYTSPQTKARREFALGNLERLPCLSLARDARDDIQRMIRAGRCPVAERCAGRKADAAGREIPKPGMSMRMAAERAIAHRRGVWKDQGKSERDWLNSLDRYVLRKYGHTPVSAFGTQDVVKILCADGDIWRTKPKMAEKLLTRIRRVVEFADAREQRDRRNPASREALEPWLPKRLVSTRHHPGPAVHDVVAAFVRQTRGDSVSAAAVALTAYTSMRVGTVVAARWRDFDLDAAEWHVPRATLKVSKAVAMRGPTFTIPLARQAVARLRALANAGPHPDRPVFAAPSAPWRPITTQAILKHVKTTTPDYVPHGWRSAMATVAFEGRWEDRDVIAVAQDQATPGGQVWTAYMRGELLERRRLLMQRWADFLHGSPARASVRRRPPERGRSPRS